MNRLRELRKAKGITMKQLGEHFGLAESTISQYETGKRQPDNELLLRFSEYFKVSTDYLLGNEQKNKPTISEDDELANENIELFKKLPDDKKQQALDYLRYLVEHQEKE